MLPEIQIIYASTSGNVEAVAYKVSEVLDKYRIKSNLHRADQTDLRTITANKFFIFASSTWEHGIINPYFDPLVAEINESDLKGKYAGFIGLGDTRYEPINFCKGIEILQGDFIKSGGKQIGTLLKINGSPYKILDSIIVDWTQQFNLQLRQYV
jgi:flavodoxin